METDEIPNKAPNDWQPLTDKHDLAVLGKLGEEATELGSAIFRCIIQGLDEKEPTTGKVNVDWLTDEIADVRAMCDLAIERLGLNYAAIATRHNLKREFKKQWFLNLFMRRGK